jgi:L-cysteine/cystine lyase
MADADDWDLRTGRGGADRADDVAERDAEARGVVAALLGAEPDDIVLTHGVRDAISVAKRLTARGRLSIVEHVDPDSGRAAQLDRQRTSNGPWLLDASNSAGVVPLAVEESGAAFVALVGHRWLLGPEGTGALWVDRRRLGVTDLAGARGLMDPLPRRAILGLARSIGWLEMYVGLPWLYERTAALARLLRHRLAAIPRVELRSPLDDSAAMAVFSIGAWNANDAIHELGARCFAVLGPPIDRGRLCVSVGAWNTEEELKRFVAAVELLAAHTADTLPRRPGLIVLGGPDPS